MTKQIQLGGTFNFPGTTLTVHRVGCGAMQLGYFTRTEGVIPW